MTAPGISFEEFRRAVVRYEAEAAAHPMRYRVMVFGFALLGYGYLVGVALLLPLFTAGFGYLLLKQPSGGLYVNLLVPLIVLWVVLLRALWVRLPAPEGMALSAAESPALFGLIRETGRRLDVPVPDQVLVNGDFNVAIVQHPRAGVIGPHRNYLILGWPFMQALSAEQFASVLAHEFGHFSGNHGRFGSWIARQRMTWAALRKRLESIGGREARIGEAIIGKFAEWYEPRFAARSFVLARAHEYEADRCAVELTSVAVVAETMVRTRAAGAWVDAHYNLAQLLEVERSPEPPADLFSRMGVELGLALPAGEVEGWLVQAWSRPTDYHDTHPSLADRFRGIGLERLDQVGMPLVRPGPAAGEVLLGPLNGVLAARLDQHWRDQVATQWTARRGELQAGQAQLAALVAKASEGPLSAAESWALARLTYAHGHPAAAEVLLRLFVAEHPDHPPGRFLLGRILLARGDEAGVTHLRTAMEQDSDARGPVSALLFDYFWIRGRVVEADAARIVGWEVAEEARAAEAERLRLDHSTVLLPHGLPAERVPLLKRAVERDPKMRKAYLVRREARWQAQFPSYILILVYGRYWTQLLGGNTSKTAGRGHPLEGSLWPEKTHLFVVWRSQRRLLSRIRAVPGALLTERA